jgi:hypothetical protein
MTTSQPPWPGFIPASAKTRFALLPGHDEFQKILAIPPDVPK